MEVQWKHKKDFQEKQTRSKRWFLMTLICNTKEITQINGYDLDGKRKSMEYEYNPDFQNLKMLLQSTVREIFFKIKIFFENS